MKDETAGFEMNPNKILILKNVKSEGPGLIQEYFEKKAIDYEVLEFYQDQRTIKIEKYSALIILGGPMSANDDLTFIIKEISLIQQIIKQKTPFLGICLGSQLLSKAMGGIVSRNNVMEIGTYDLQLSENGLNSPLFKNMPRTFKVFQWHGETFSIPDGGSNLGSTSTCTHQALQVGNAFGLQFHVEFTHEIIKRLLQEHYVEVTENEFSPNVILNEFSHEFPQLKKHCGLILENFLSLFI